MRIRIAKQDAAYLYALLEGYEGLVNFTTMTQDKNLGYRDIELDTTPSMRSQLDPLIVRLKNEFDLHVIASNTDA